MKPIVNIVEYGVAEILVPHLERRVHVSLDREKALKYGCVDYHEPQLTTEATTAYNTVSGCYVALWFKHASPRAGTVAHECLHALNIIHDYVGINADRSNDETDTYMLGYLVDGVCSALRMLNKQENNQ